MDVKNIISDVDENLKNFQSAYRNLLSMRDEIKENISALQKSLAEVEEALGVKGDNDSDEKLSIETLKKTDPKEYVLMNDAVDNDDRSELTASDEEESQPVNDVVEEKKATTAKKTTARKTAAKKADDTPAEKAEVDDEPELLVDVVDTSEDKKVDKISSKEKVQQVIDAVDEDDDAELLLDDDESDDDVADDIDELPF